METIAKQISDQVNSRYVTPEVVQSFLALSKPVRLTMADYLNAAESWINVQRGNTLMWSASGDMLSNKLNIIFTAANQLLAPVDSFLQAIPLDSIAKESPEITSILETIAENVPIKIPVDVGTVLSGLGGFDFFDGINSYKDLRNKIDDLEFRLARATAFSSYTSGTLASLNAQLEKVLAYKSVLNLLND